MSIFMLSYILSLLAIFTLWVLRGQIARSRVAQWLRQLDYLATQTSLSPIRRGFAPGFLNYKRGCTRLAAASDKAYQLFAHGRWFFPAPPTTKTGRHDIVEILLKVALNTKKSNQIKSIIMSIVGINYFPQLTKPPTCSYYNRNYDNRTYMLSIFSSY